MKNTKIMLIIALALLSNAAYGQWHCLFTLDEYSPSYKTRYITNGNDINHDGYDDLLFGNRYFNENEGMAKIIFGSPEPDSSSDWIVHGPGTYPLYFGSQILNVGDLNGDGEGDIVVTEPYEDMEGCGRSGNLYLYFSSPLDTVADLVISGFMSDSDLAYGDFNGDGYTDIITSNYGGPFSFGTARMYLGGPDMDVFSDWSFSTQAEQLLISSGACNDFNGDGYDDFTFWISDEILEEPEHTTISIYAGSPNLEFEPCVTFLGPALETSSDQYGFGWIGDFNADGFDDFKINRLKQDEEYINYSKIYFGNSLNDTLISFYLYNYDSYDSVYVQSSVLDCVNNDLFSDILIYYENMGNSGLDSAVIVYGNIDSLSMVRETLISPNLLWINNCGNINGGEYSELAFTFTGDTGSMAVFSKDYTYINQGDKPESNMIDFNTYPNPFNNNLYMSLSNIPIGEYEVSIYDICGRLVKSYNHSHFGDSGNAVLNWNGGDIYNQKVSSGIYFIKVNFGDEQIVRHVTYLK